MKRITLKMKREERAQRVYSYEEWIRRETVYQQQMARFTAIVQAQSQLIDALQEALSHVPHATLR